MSKHLAATLYTSRHLSTRTRWRPFYRCSRCLSTASGPALFRQLEDGTEQPITEDDLFKYQRHRWLHNDAKEQDLRYRSFDVTALIERALKAKRERADGLTCVKILKLLEGDHNKVLLLTMSNGDELIARLPNPIAGSNWFTVSSEVATRRFVENICNVPMPRVWDWDFRDRNTVGAEWIIESKAAGEPLRKSWFNMSREAQLGVIEQVVDLETKLASLKFSSHGSIYLERWLYAKKLRCRRMASPKVIVNKDEAFALMSERFYRQFVIGPSTDRRLYRGPGDLSKQFRGPFTDLFHYADILSRNERRYILNNPWAKANYITSTQDNQDQSEYMELIYKYSALQEQLIRPEFNSDPCTLSHPNLSLDNIWIDPKTEKIVSLTGWQSTAITPPLLKRPYPRFLDTEFQTQSGDRSQILPNERYRELVKISDPLRYDRIFSNPQKYELLVGPMSSIFNAWNNGGIFRLRESLLAVRNLQQLVLTNPVPELEQFSSAELESHAKEKYARQELDMLFNMIQNVQHTVNIPRDGRVLAEDFERAQKLNEDYRQQYINLAAGGRKTLLRKAWPFGSRDDKEAQNKASIPRESSLVEKHSSSGKLPTVVRKINVD